MRIISDHVIGGASSALVVEEASPSYPDLMAERDRLIIANAKLIDELAKVKRNHSHELWEAVEEIACGARMDCVNCGQPKPCQCDKK